MTSWNLFKIWALVCIFVAGAGLALYVRGQLTWSSLAEEKLNLCRRGSTNVVAVGSSYTHANLALSSPGFVNAGLNGAGAFEIVWILEHLSQRTGRDTLVLLDLVSPEAGWSSDAFSNRKVAVADQAFVRNVQRIGGYGVEDLEALAYHRVANAFRWSFPRADRDQLGFNGSWALPFPDQVDRGPHVAMVGDLYPWGIYVREVRQLRSRSGGVVVVFHPVEYPDSFKERVYEAYEYGEFSGILDYSVPEFRERVPPWAWFDAGHFNGEGARWFSGVVEADLRALGLLTPDGSAVPVKAAQESIMELFHG